jgi:hypothetical protein
MVKTRRRKGLSEVCPALLHLFRHLILSSLCLSLSLVQDVAIGKYFDDPMLLDIAKQQAEMGAYWE